MQEATSYTRHCRMAKFNQTWQPLPTRLWSLGPARVTWAHLLEAAGIGKWALRSEAVMDGFLPAHYSGLASFFPRNYLEIHLTSEDDKWNFRRLKVHEDQDMNLILKIYDCSGGGG